MDIIVICFCLFCLKDGVYKRISAVYWEAYIRGYDPYGEDVAWYSRDTLEKAEIADFLPNAEILLIADDKVYYYGVGGMVWKMLCIAVIWMEVIIRP